MLVAGPVRSHIWLPDGIEAAAGPLALRITALRPDILRIRVKPGGSEWQNGGSWSVLPEARSAAIEVESFDSDESIGFRTGRLVLRVLRQDARVIVATETGEVLHEDAIGLPAFFQNGGFSAFRAIQPGERFFGLGDKTGRLARNDQAFVLWNTDNLNFQESTDPIYKSIPFVLGLTPRGGYGLLLDNTGRTHFDFGKRHRNVFTFGAELGDFDTYLIFAEHAKALPVAYAFLTGLPPLPPRWSFGYQQSRYSYMSADAVRDIAAALRRERIPADAIYLDIDYQDRFRSFTTDPERFPDLPLLVRDLQAQNLRLVTIVDAQTPVVEDGTYAASEQGFAGEHFVRAADGEVFQGKMWGGNSAFPDFARAATREWWGGLHAEFAAAGVAGIWNDMNEPTAFDTPGNTLPLDAVHRIEEPGETPRSAPHREVHNAYGLLNTRATHEGLRKLLPDKRPFVLTRATCAGGQRYATTWTGDNSATWNHLRLNVAMLLNLGLSGFPFAGADLGGFFGSAAPDLLTRWYQLGAFMPLFRSHAFQESAPREPWLDGEPHVSIRRRFVEARYRLLPYIYTLAEEASRTGVPMMRPMFLEFPALASTRAWITRDPLTQFMLGSALVIAPAPFAEFTDPYVVTLPRVPWYDYWTGLHVSGTGTDPSRPALLKVAQSLEALPVFARGGTIVPRQPVVQSTQDDPGDTLELLIYPGPNCHGTLYHDAGDGFGYQRGEYLRLRLNHTSEAGRTRIRIAPREGSYAPWWQKLALVVHGFAGEVQDLPDGILALKHDNASRTLRITLPDPTAGIEIAFRTN